MPSLPHGDAYFCTGSRTCFASAREKGNLLCEGIRQQSVHRFADSLSRGNCHPKGQATPAQPLPAAQSVSVNEQIASSKLVLPTPSIIGKWRRKGYGDLEFFKGDDLEFSSFMLGQSIACKYRFVGANQIRVDVPTFYWFSIDRGKIERPSHSEFCTVVFSGNEMKLLGHGEIFPGELQFSRAQ